MNSLPSSTHIRQVYAKVSGEPPLEAATIDVSSKEFYGEGYDDSDKRIPDMTIINKQLGMNFLFSCTSVKFLVTEDSLNLIVNVCWMISRMESQNISLGST